MLDLILLCKDSNDISSIRLEQVEKQCIECGEEILDLMRKINQKSTHNSLLEEILEEKNERCEEANQKVKEMMKKMMEKAYKELKEDRAYEQLEEGVIKLLTRI